MKPQNKLYYGDNLEVLRKYIKDESIDLCYIDPPFNSKRNYNQIYNNIGKEDKAQAQAFVDTWTWDEIAERGNAEIQSNYNQVFTKQSIYLIQGLEKVLGKSSLFSYLVSMTLRIAEIFRVLKPTGSFYLHCDPTASHYLKIILDSIFCSQGGDYINDIIWKRTNNPKGSQFKAKKYGVYTDNIFFYVKSSKYLFNLDLAKNQLNENELKKKYPYKDDNGNYYSAPILRSKSMGGRPSLVYEYKGFTPDFFGWRMTKENLIKLDIKGDLGWSSNNKPFRKLRPENDKGDPISNLWDDINRLYESKEALSYPTQKPEALLARIINASSLENDVVFDAYCGCGTTVAVAQKLNRKWIGIDITYQSISLILKRLEDKYGIDVLDSIELHGFPKDFESAKALAEKKDDRIRKEFEKWAVLTFSRNKAIINEKKGGDGGIDGVSFILDKDENGTHESKEVLFSVKSNKVLTPSVIRDLNGTIEREGAVMGYLITLYKMDNLVKEAKQYGNYVNTLFGKTYQKINVITIDEILSGKLMDLPISLEVLKKATFESQDNQIELGF